jgi:hypothetical protein
VVRGPWPLARSVLHPPNFKRLSNSQSASQSASSASGTYRQMGGSVGHTRPPPPTPALAAGPRGVRQDKTRLRLKKRGEALPQLPQRAQVLRDRHDNGFLRAAPAGPIGAKAHRHRAKAHRHRGHWGMPHNPRQGASSWRTTSQGKWWPRKPHPTRTHHERRSPPRAF